MFNQPSNAVCNNILFSCNRIDRMHESMTRLYEIAQRRFGIQRQSDLAAALNESQQTVKNWEARGISKDGALKAQKRFGCDANWLLVDGPASNISAHQVREPSPQYAGYSIAWSWPFCSVSPVQYSLLSEKERDHIEEDILLRIEGRTEEKHESPAEKITKARAA